jgi:hypothetical protein
MVLAPVQVSIKLKKRINEALSTLDGADREDR